MYRLRLHFSCSYPFLVYCRWFLPQAELGANPHDCLSPPPSPCSVSSPLAGTIFTTFFLLPPPPASHALIVSHNHAPKDAGWWSCPGQCERFHSRRGLIISATTAAAAQGCCSGSVAIRQQRFSRVAGICVAVLVGGKSGFDFKDFIGEW